MELKRCPRCGNFYNSDLNVCQDCKTNENLDVSKLKGYIDQYGMNTSTEEMAINTGVNVKNINRYLSDTEKYGLLENKNNMDNFSGSEINL
mgnify:CR=1 FL=1